MQLIEMFYDEIQDAVDRKVPFVIPIGTLEYHARHASCGTDTLVVTGCLRELEKEKERLLATLKMTEKTKKEGGMVEVKDPVSFDKYNSLFHSPLNQFPHP